MSQEFERVESSEILPQNFAELTDREVAPVAERAAKRLEITRGVKNPHWRGVEETLEGMAGWFKTKAGELRGKSVRVVAGAALVAELMSACSPAVSAKPIETIAPNKPIATETFIPTRTASPTPEPTKTPETESFPVCTTAEKVADCYIPPEAAVNGDYVKYLKTLDWPAFDESKLIFRDLVRFHYPTYDEIRYSLDTIPNYPVPETRPYQRLTFGWTEYNDGKYVVTGIRYYVKGMDPKNYPWIVGLIYVNISNRATDDQMKKTALEYINDMNVPVYQATNQFIFAWKSMGITDPLVNKSFTLHPDIQQKIDSFIGGDPTALDGVALSAVSEKILSGHKRDR